MFSSDEGILPYPEKISLYVLDASGRPANILNVGQTKNEIAWHFVEFFLRPLSHFGAEILKVVN